MFWLELMAAKALLPGFGGSAGVWAAAVACFQTALLAGYVAAWGASRRPGPESGAWLWSLALLCVAWFFPFTPETLLAVQPYENPGVSALVGLFAAAGPAGAVLAGASVSLQAGLVRRWRDPTPLYAASNAGSFAGLAAYLLIIEPYLDLPAQAAWWTGGVMLAGMAFAASLALFRRVPVLEALDAVKPRISGFLRLLWFLSAMAGAALFMSVSNVLGVQLPAAPLLWAPPLAVYLASLALVFSGRAARLGWLADRLPLLAAAGAAAWVFRADLAAWSGVGFAACLLVLEFGLCTVCHWRLHVLRSAGAGLGEYYFWIALGGLAGGAVGGWAAPYVFDGSYEFLLALVLAGWTAGLVQAYAGKRLARWGGGLTVASLATALLLLMDPAGGLLAVLAVVVAGCWLLRGVRAGYLETALFMAVCVYSCGLTHRAHVDGIVAHQRRTWYSMHTVADRKDTRYLLHGATVHGMESLLARHRGKPSAYYHPETPAGEFFLENMDQGKPVAVAGMGAATLSVYAEAGQKVVFYELDSHTEYIAREFFSFLERSPGDCSVVLGDCRRMLARAAHGTYGTVVVDVFSGGAVPVHCLTVEGLAVFLRSVGEQGVVLLHLSNKHLDLTGPVAAAGLVLGTQAVFRQNVRADSPLALPSVWAAMTRDAAMAGQLGALGWGPRESLQKRFLSAPPRVWTDRKAALLPALR